MTKPRTKTKQPPARIEVRNVQASILARATDDKTYFDASFQRSYIDANGQWHSMQSFDLNGLLALQHAIVLAIDKMLELMAQDVSDRPEADNAE